MKAALRDILGLLRVPQWTKNGLVLAGYVFSLGDPAQHAAPHPLPTALAAALLFCLASSGVYILNDLRDVEADRVHPLKRHRPIARGAVSVRSARGIAALLSLAALGGAAAISPAFTAALAAYLALQALYTFVLKHIALADVFTIAAGFLLRAVAGAIAIDVDFSPWLLLCTLMLALFLGFCKRRQELVALRDGSPTQRPALRQYNRAVLDQLISISAASTVVCYSLYTLWPGTVDKFGTRGLAATIPLVVFGIFRYVFLVYAREHGEQPEQVLLTDRPLLATIALYGAAVLCIVLN
jgi:4-hydroxybenzoate polyprenyltransferase